MTPARERDYALMHITNIANHHDKDSLARKAIIAQVREACDAADAHIDALVAAEVENTINDPEVPPTEGEPE